MILLCLLLFAILLLSAGVYFWLADTILAESPLRYIFSGIVAVVLVSVLYDICLVAAFPSSCFIWVSLFTSLGLLYYYYKQQLWSFPKLFGGVLSMRASLYSVSAWALIYYLSTQFIPHSGRWGRWDARAIWTLHALFLSYPQHWADQFSPVIAWSHADYPLMLPSFIAILWSAMGSTSALVPCIIAYGVFITVLLTTCAALKGKDNFILGILGLLAFVLTVNFARISAFQGADTFLSLFILMAFVLFRLAEQGKNVKIVLLTGFIVGFAGWIKNEGIAFMLVFSLGFVWKFRKSPILLSYYIAGLLLPLLIIISFKMFYAPANDIITGQHLSTISKLLDINRHKLVIKSFSANMWHLYPVLLGVMVLIILNGYKKLWDMPLFLLVVMTAVYYFTFILTPRDLSWHLETASERLFMQLFPAFVYVLLSLLGGAGSKSIASQ
jgi:hypothetical protein